LKKSRAFLEHFSCAKEKRNGLVPGGKEKVRGMEEGERAAGEQSYFDERERRETACI